LQSTPGLKAAQRPVLSVALCVRDSGVRHRSGLVEAVQGSQRPTTEGVCCVGRACNG
jgi:hypothetical protein